MGRHARPFLSAGHTGQLIRDQIDTGERKRLTVNQDDFVGNLGHGLQEGQIDTRLLERKRGYCAAVGNGHTQISILARGQFDVNPATGGRRVHSIQPAVYLIAIHPYPQVVTACLHLSSTHQGGSVQATTRDFQRETERCVHVAKDRNPTSIGQPARLSDCRGDVKLGLGGNVAKHRDIISLTAGRDVPRIRFCRDQLPDRFFNLQCD